jgi:two-component system sensor histidine kinase BaeS
VRLAALIAVVGAFIALTEFQLITARFGQLLGRLPPELRREVRRTLFNETPGRQRRLVELIQGDVYMALAIGLVASVLVALLAARYFSRPLEGLAATARRLATGDLSARSRTTESVSEISALIRDVNRMAERLEALEAERRYASAAIAHELRTPLTALRTRTSALQEGIYPMNETEVAKLHAQIDVLERLAEDLQTLTLTDAGALRLNPQMLNLGTLAAQVVTEFGPLAKGSRVRLSLESSGMLNVRADPERLRQVIYNLLENALKHTPVGGQVQIHVHGDATGAHLSVTDSGPGVNEAQLDDLFARFYRADVSRARSSGGSGLGLTVVRAIIESHGGSVRAQRGSLGGLEVLVRLPAPGR